MRRVYLFLTIAFLFLPYSQGYGQRGNLSTPLSLKEVGYCDTPDYALCVAVSGSYAYVADVEAGLRVIDISNPSSPKEVGYYDTSNAVGVAVSRSYAYVADDYAGLLVIKIKP